MFVQGQVYRRRHLHEMYGGQRQGGISTPAQHPFIFLFTGENGTQHGYQDGWQSDGLFLYTGEGQRGDMRFVMGNRAIRDHLVNGKDLHLFEQARRAHVRYLGQFVCTGSQRREAPGTDGKTRSAIVFELTLLAEYTAEPDAVDRLPSFEGFDRTDKLRTLRQLALEDAAEARDATERRTICRRRSEAIKQYVLERASGTCEGCNSPAPFVTKAGKPYLEPHHIRKLSDGGPDHPRWVAAVCANCHRRAHFSADAHIFNETLLTIVGQLEETA